MRSLPFIFLLLTLLGAVPPAEAASPRQQADTLFRRAHQLYSRGKFTPALKLFQRAQRIYPSYKLELNIAYTYEALKRPVEAASYLELSLVHAPGGSPSSAMAAALQKLRGLRRQLGSVSIMGAPEGAAVRVDGQERGLTPLPHRVYLLPGSYRLVVAHESQELLGEDLQLRAGQHHVAQVPAAAPAITPPDLAAVAPTEAQPVQWVTIPEDAEPPAQPFYQTWWFWTAGAAVVGATLGVVLATQLGGDDRLPSGDSGTIYLDR